MKISPHHLILLGIPLLFIIKFSPIRIYYNHTPSMPIGFYLVNKWYLQISKKDMVVACLPNKQVINFSVARGYVLPEKNSPCSDSEPLVKTVYGTPMDYYSVKHQVMYVNNTKVPNSTIRIVDSKKRSLPQISNNQLGLQQYLIFGVSDNSYDSRYFGPIKESNIVGKAYYIGKLL